MRAGAWSSSRDIAAAQLSWERALQVADALPADTPNRMAKRIAPRTLICGNTFGRFHPDISPRFEELRDLCTQADDKASLAMGMAGMTVEHVLHNRLLDASRLASEYMALVESIGDPALTIGTVVRGDRGEAPDRRDRRRSCDGPKPLSISPAEDSEQGQVHHRFPAGDGVGLARCRRASRKAARAGAMTSSKQVPLRDNRTALSQAAIIAYKYAGLSRAACSWRTNPCCARSNQR